VEKKVIEKRPLKSADVAAVAAPNGGEPATLAQVQAEIEARLVAGPEPTLAEKFALFEKKLKAALQDGSASELGKLLGQTDNAIAAAEQEALAARERALDPVSRPTSKSPARPWRIARSISAACEPSNRAC
jgi:hypothetical protein